MTPQQVIEALLPGTTVVITGCEANDHAHNSPGCLCRLVGTEQVVDRLYDSPFAGTPTWHLKDSEKRIRLSEITIIRRPT